MAKLLCNKNKYFNCDNNKVINLTNKLLNDYDDNYYIEIKFPRKKKDAIRVQLIKKNVEKKLMIIEDEWSFKGRKIFDKNGMRYNFDNDSIKQDDQDESNSN